MEPKPIENTVVGNVLPRLPGLKQERKKQYLAILVVNRFNESHLKYIKLTIVLENARLPVGVKNVMAQITHDGKVALFLINGMAEHGDVKVKKQEKGIKVYVKDVEKFKVKIDNLIFIILSLMPHLKALKRLIT